MRLSVAINALAMLGLMYSGAALACSDHVLALASGMPAGLVFGLTYRRGCPLAKQ